MLMGCVLALSWGCQKQYLNTESPTSSQEHEHFPAHWPHTIFAAAERLHAISEADNPTSSNKSVSISKEWADLIRWLPELVADSDISEPDFQVIDTWSTRALVIIEDRIGNGKTFDELRRIDGLDENIAAMLTLCRAEKARIDAL